MLQVQTTSHVRLVGSAALQPIERLGLLAARGQEHILITGERTPAKPALARFIHEQSDMSTQRFAMLKCDRLSDGQLESELFGSPNQPGALTSLFCGTVFLDEVDAMSAAMQIRLNQMLRTVNGHARIIASTAVNLSARVAAGFFLSDLYERLSAVTLAVPSLRAEKTEIESTFGQFHFVGLSAGQPAVVYRAEWPESTKRVSDDKGKAA